MADKKTQLSITIRTVDQATAGIKAISARLDALTKRKEITKAVGDFKGALSELGKATGVTALVGAFKTVGSVIGDIIKKIALIGGVIGGLVIGAAAGVFHLVGEFDDLGKASKRLGVSVDFLASLRNAAERTGAPVEALDEGLQSFSQNLGQARAGTGRMTKFLERVYPPLLNALKGAKSNEEAFRILADTMSKLKDPAKRAALAQKTVGDAALAPLLARGAAGVKELQDRYIGFAGSQEAAADAASETGDAMKDLHAAEDGAKAAIVSGLAPALKILVERLREWLVDHREDIAKWAKTIGDELPGAVEKVVDAIKAAVAWLEKAFDWCSKLVDKLGGLGKVLDVLSAGSKILTEGPKLSIFSEARDGDSPLAAKAREIRDRYAPKVDDVDTSSLFDQADVSGAARNVAAASESALHARAAQQIADALAGRPTSQAKITIDIANAPRGTRVSTNPGSTADVDTNVGYQMAPGLP